MTTGLMVNSVAEPSNVVIVRLGEYMVRRKSPATKMMIRRLVESISRRINREGLEADVQVIEGSRIIVRAEHGLINRFLGILPNVFGVSSVSPALEVDSNPRSVVESVINIIKELRPGSIALELSGNPRIFSRREYLWIITDLLKKKLNIRYDLTNPELRIGIDVRNDKSYIYTRYIKGVGGLPYGVEGCLVSLVSGGIDSAVASWLTMKRGVRIILLYIDYGKYWPASAYERLKRMIEKLYYYVPWDSLKAYRIKGYEELVFKADVPARLRCLFCKANMYRAASYLADDEGCLGISTGEAVGQVASQTLRNLSILTMLTRKPIYRPLSFMDKLEIIDLGRRLGFGELAVETGGCALKPEHPETAASNRDLKILRRALEESEEEARSIYRENLEAIHPA